MASRNRSGKQATQTTNLPSDSVDQGKLLKRAVDWIVKDNIFCNLKKHGNCNWSPSAIVIVAVFTAWMPSPQLTEAFSKAGELSLNLFGFLAIETYQGMMRALVSNGSNLLIILWNRIHALMEEVSPDHFRIDGWVPLAVDGS